MQLMKGGLMMVNMLAMFQRNGEHGKQLLNKRDQLIIATCRPINMVVIF